MTTLINDKGQMEVFIDFPAFYTHEIAASWRCQSCSGKLLASDAVNKGYPPGRGRYAIKCRKCDFSLFYDLKPHEIDHSSNCASVTGENCDCEDR